VKPTESFGSLADYLNNRKTSTGTNNRVLTQGLTYHNAIGAVVHPTPEAGRQWDHGQIPRLELVDGIAQFFGDSVDEVRALAGYPPTEPSADVDELVHAYRAAISRTPSHLRYLANRVAIAAVSAMYGGDQP